MGAHQGAIWKEAAKLDWLRSRPDLQEPEHQRLLDRLELAYPDHDALYPWLVREQKKGRLNDPYGHAVSLRWPVGHNHFGDNDIPYFRDPFHHMGTDGRMSYLKPDDLDQIQDWMKYQKQAGKGVDIMKHEVGQALDLARKNDIGGEVVHSYDAPYNGWNMVRLRNKRDMVTEGDRMSHCIGGGGAGGYISKNDEGKGAYYSLRDPDNDPVATLEMLPKGNHYFMCPNCKKPAFGQIRRGTTDPTGERDTTEGTSLICENCDHPLASSTNYHYDPSEFQESELLPDVKRFPTKINHKRPSADHMRPAQLFGHSDSKLEPTHEELVNNWLTPMGHPYTESDGNYEEEEEPEEFEPWWNEYYSVPGASNVDDWFNHHVNGEYHDEAPDEYANAWQDANNHGLEGPELDLEPPDIHNIFQDLTEGSGRVDPHQIRDLFKTMHEHGYGDEFLGHVNNWLNDDYHPYVDPYRQDEGAGYDLNSHGGDPTVSPSHYPESHPDEDYLARNFLYHLDKMRDPQKGDIPGINRQEGTGDLKSMEYRYPEIEQQGEMWQAPRPEFNRDLPNYPGRRQQELFNPPPQTALRADRVQNESPFQVRRPTSPEMAFGQPQLDIHQRSLPGMPEPWSLEHYPQGQQQGGLYPKHWYIDYAKQRAAETDLPEYLFSPNRYGYHSRYGNTPNRPDEQQPGMSMWDPSRTGEGSTLNTHEDLSRGDLPPEYQGGDIQYQPRVQWQAKTAGPWTDYEQSQVTPGPHQGVPHLNGDVVETNVSHYQEIPQFEWRRPVVYDKSNDRMIVGQPSMQHKDMMQHMGLPDPWIGGQPHPDYLPGFIDTEGKIQQGLDFFAGHDQVPNPERFHNWVEDRFGVRNQNQGSFSNDDWIQSKVAWQEPENDEFEGPYPEDFAGDPEATYRDRLNKRWRPIRQEWRADPNPFKWDHTKNPGKAFLDDEGQLHTWDEGSSADPGWMHSDQAEIRGVTNNSSTHIYMRPPGGFSPAIVDDRYGVWRNSELANKMWEQMQQAHPGVKWPQLEPKEEVPQEPEAEDEFGDLWHGSSYHPAQDDEWAAGDEPSFSAVIPESRWGG